MRRKTRLILLTLIGTMIILLIALGFSYAYMKGLIGDGAKSSLSVNNCAKILLTESGSSISLSNTYPMSDNAGLNTTPYTFGIRSTCSGNRGFKLYIVTIAGNTLSANNVKYALTLKGSKEIITSGKIGSLSSGSSDFNTAATNQLSSKVGTVDSIYYTYEDNIDLGEVTYYDLYMWVDSTATNSVANQTFTAAVTVLEGPYDNSDIKIMANNITTYDANVSCSGTSDAKWNPLNRSVELFDITKKPTNCTVSTKTNTNLGNLKDIVEAEGQYEDGIPSGYTKIAQTGYSGNNPINTFYTTSLSTTATSGDTDNNASFTFNTTSNMWVTSNLSASRYYYYLFNVSEAGTYQFCWNKSTGNNNRLYIYKGTSNLIYNISVTVTNSSELCVGIGDLTTTDVIKVIQYTNTGNVSSMKFGFKKSSTTTTSGYRYEGTNPNNYVWFNNELWRIIGSVPTKIDSVGTTTNLVKIIRAESIGGLVWNTSTPRPDWNTSTLYTLLNTYYLGAENATGNSYCYGSQSFAKAKCDYRYTGINLSGYYGSMIKEVYWATGGSQVKLNANYVYSDEISRQTMMGYVGIMNMSDYGFASNYNRPTRTGLIQYTSYYVSEDWLFGKGYEWTLTPNPADNRYAHSVNMGGSVNDGTIHQGYAVRPVVYLDSSVYVASGDGTQGDPYKLGM